jgi:predicted metal-binding protein
MKKKLTKLVLSRETLRDLEEGKMKEVKGGSDGTGLACAGSHCLNGSCNSCNTCGTRLC